MVAWLDPPTTASKTTSLINPFLGTRKPFTRRRRTTPRAAGRVEEARGEVVEEVEEDGEEGVMVPPVPLVLHWDDSKTPRPQDGWPRREARRAAKRTVVNHPLKPPLKPPTRPPTRPLTKPLRPLAAGGAAAGAAAGAVGEGGRRRRNKDSMEAHQWYVLPPSFSLLPSFFVPSTVLFHPSISYHTFLSLIISLFLIPSSSFLLPSPFFLLRQVSGKRSLGNLLEESSKRHSEFIKRTCEGGCMYVCMCVYVYVCVCMWGKGEGCQC